MLRCTKPSLPSSPALPLIIVVIVGLWTVCGQIPRPLDSGLTCRRLPGSEEHEATIQARNDPENHVGQVEPHSGLHMCGVCTFVRVIISAMKVDDCKDAKGDGPEDAMMAYQQCTTQLGASPGLHSQQNQVPSKENMRLHKRQHVDDCRDCRHAGHDFSIDPFMRGGAAIGAVGTKAASIEPGDCDGEGKLHGARNCFCDEAGQGALLLDGVFEAHTCS